MTIESIVSITYIYIYNNNVIHYRNKIILSNIKVYNIDL